MIGKNRLRWPWKSAVTASLALALAACGPEYPNTTFAPLSDLGRDIDEIWDVLLLWGMIVFVLVEVALLYIVFRYRHTDSAPEPKQTHGHTTLEIVWTMIPAVILVFIALPTVSTIFKTQAPPPANALQIDVRGHQWWWEFEYPELGIKTANELYIPTGRPVSFNIQTFNVLHSFWIPRLAGKRDAVNRRVNRIWFTAYDSAAGQVFNGSCTEFCGDSHANMQFRVFVLNETDFASWAAHQRSPAIGGGWTPPGAAGGAPAAGATGAQTTGAAATSTTAPGAASADSMAAQPAPVYEFPSARVPTYAIPTTPYSKEVPFPDNLVGDPVKGKEWFFVNGFCISCHTLNGTSAQSVIGPNLTHIGSRTTIAGAMFPNTPEYMARWIKNAYAMKAGAKMTPQGKGLRSPLSGIPGMLEDQQIADIVAYLRTLK